MSQSQEFQGKSAVDELIGHQDPVFQLVSSVLTCEGRGSGALQINTPTIAVPTHNRAKKTPSVQVSVVGRRDKRVTEGRFGAATLLLSPPFSKPPAGEQTCLPRDHNGRMSGENSGKRVTEVSWWFCALIRRNYLIEILLVKAKVDVEGLPFHSSSGVISVPCPLL